MLDCIVRPYNRKIIAFCLPFVPANTKIIFLTEGFNRQLLPSSRWITVAWNLTWTTLLNDLDSHRLKPDPDHPASDYFLLHFIISDLKILFFSPFWLPMIVLLYLNFINWYAANLFHPPRAEIFIKSSRIWSVWMLFSRVICIMRHLLFCAFLY